MASLILYQCPRTGLHVQARLDNKADDTMLYETVTCPACTQFHFIDRQTGKLLADRTK